MMRALLAALALISGAAPLAAAPLNAAPSRVVSLNLCTDELLLMLAAPGQIASVSFLGARADETPLAARAHGIPINNGRLDTVMHYAPDLLLTTGNPYASELAKRVGLRVVNVPPPENLADLRQNITLVAQALGRGSHGAAVLTKFDRELGAVPLHPKTALLLGAGGTTVTANGLAAQLLRYAGLQQMPGDGQINLEKLLIDPPQVLIKTNYHADQNSIGQNWLAHPALRALPATRMISVDGRIWTCMGPLVGGEIARLRHLISAAQ
jgi:iron complex transport system substrate-binding protein